MKNNTLCPEMFNNGGKGDGDERYPDEAEDSDKGVQVDPHRLILAQFGDQCQKGVGVSGKGDIEERKHGPAPEAVNDAFCMGERREKDQYGEKSHR